MIRFKFRSKQVDFRHNGIQINSTYEGIAEICTWRGVRIYEIRSHMQRLTMQEALIDARFITT